MALYLELQSRVGFFYDFHFGSVLNAATALALGAYFPLGLFLHLGIVLAAINDAYTFAVGTYLDALVIFHSLHINNLSYLMVSTATCRLNPYIEP